MLEKIIKDIIEKGILPDSRNTWTRLTGGTESTVGLIRGSSQSSSYIVKANTPERIAREADFYQLYGALPLLPKVVYVDPDFRYIVYRYLPGETAYERGNKLTLLVELINGMIHHYVKPETHDDYTWIEDPSRVQHDLNYVHSVVGSHLPEIDHMRVKTLAKRRSARVTKEPMYVLHGDCGVHNFLFEQGRLSGIIDPIPCVGRPIYDLLYAFCSSPDDLQLSALMPAVTYMNNGQISIPELVEDVIIALYSRISTCITHHPDDLPEYLHAWTEWIRLSHLHP